MVYVRSSNGQTKKTEKTEKTESQCECELQGSVILGRKSYVYLLSCQELTMFSPLYGSDEDILIMFQPYHSLVNLPHNPDSEWTKEQSELVGIDIVTAVANRVPPPHKKFCKIGAGATNEQFRKWCFDNKLVSLPLNVIMVEITFGGSNAPICHGAGFSTQTLSDLVEEVEYVDAKGGIQTVHDKEELRAASGCFGLLGIVISLTLLVDDMCVAEMKPIAVDVALAIPPPKGYLIPKDIADEMRKNNIGEEELEHARKKFIRRCKEDYYLEWFWFPYNSKVWVNTWSSASFISSTLYLVLMDK
jgi:hypothetical protein